MGKPYSQDLRERVIAAVDTGTGAYVAALLFQRSFSTVLEVSHARARSQVRTPTRMAQVNG